MIYTAMLFLLILLSSQLSVVQAQRFRCPEIDNDPCEPLVTVHQISDGVCVEECRRLGLFAKVLSQSTCGVCPTASPTESPTPNPTNRPTPNPTNRPTPNPTNRPTPNPTNRPTPNPTNRPTPNPTDSPTPNPTNRPTPNPTDSPTPNPTNSPTPNPTNRPTPNPTNSPTPNPTISPCLGAYNVLNETERGVDFNDGPGGFNCCDQLNSGIMCPDWQGNGWYRFMGQGGTRMPDVNDLIPLTFSCGTSAPGWMNGVHPVVADGIVSRQVCFNWDVSTCWVSVNINVVNCDDFFLYKLAEATCTTSFCATNAPLGGN